MIQNCRSAVHVAKFKAAVCASGYAYGVSRRVEHVQDVYRQDGVTVEALFCGPSTTPVEGAIGWTG